jgi:hypothetical protein
VSPPKPRRKDNLLLSLAINIVAPSLVLSRLSGPEMLGPVGALGVALAFPVGFQIWDLTIKKEFSWIALFGLLNVLSTGLLTLYAQDHLWFAVKETAFPLLVGIFVLVSSWVDKPFIERIFFRPEIFDIDKLEAALASSNQQKGFRQVLVRGNGIFAVSFGVSAILNYGLAVYTLKSPVGSTEFNVELGKMTALSFPVITLPASIIVLLATFYLFRSVARLTGRPASEFLAAKT